MKLFAKCLLLIVATALTMAAMLVIFIVLNTHGLIYAVLAWVILTGFIGLMWSQVWDDLHATPQDKRSQWNRQMREWSKAGIAYSFMDLQRTAEGLGFKQDEARELANTQLMKFFSKIYQG